MRYNFPLAFQTVLPQDYESDPDFIRLLSALRDLAFAGVELNIKQPNSVDTTALRRFLASYNLCCTMFATGLTARTEGLSLSDPDETVRAHSVSRTRDFIDFASSMDAGVIIGFLKGRHIGEKARLRDFFRKSIEEIGRYAEAKKVHVLIEATNRYESAVANTLAETAGLIEECGSPFLHVLPDTFHMNIEESSFEDALMQALPWIISVHLSDNNRYFPGFGAIDFGEICAFLSQIGFSGGLAIEGEVKSDVVSDLTASVAYLESV